MATHRRHMLLCLAMIASGARRFRHQRSHSGVFGFVGEVRELLVCDMKFGTELLELGRYFDKAAFHQRLGHHSTLGAGVDSHPTSNRRELPRLLLTRLAIDLGHEIHQLPQASNLVVEGFAHRTHPKLVNTAVPVLAKSATNIVG